MSIPTTIPRSKTAGLIVAAMRPARGLLVERGHERPDDRRDGRTADLGPRIGPDGIGPGRVRARVGVAPSTGAGGGAGGTVAIKDFSFDPGAAAVKVGDKVTWTNQGGVAHTVTFDEGGIDSGSLAAGKTFEQTFATAGTFAYHCSIHSSMTGTVVVAP